MKIWKGLRRSIKLPLHKLEHIIPRVLWEGGFSINIMRLISCCFKISSFFFETQCIPVLTIKTQMK